MTILRSIDGIAQDYEKDVDDWLAEGEARGEARGKLDALRIILLAKFGRTSAEIDERLTRLTLEELNDLLARSMSWMTIESLTEYLHITR